MSRRSSPGAKKAKKASPVVHHRWRCALVGGGRLGQYYADAYRTFEDTELVGLMEPNTERGNAVCEKFGIPANYTELKKMLEETRSEIVTVVTPGAYFKQTVLTHRF